MITLPYYYKHAQIDKYGNINHNVQANDSRETLEVTHAPTNASDVETLTMTSHLVVTNITDI